MANQSNNKTYLFEFPTTVGNALEFYTCEICQRIHQTYEKPERYCALLDFYVCLKCAAKPLPLKTEDLDFPEYMECVFNDD